VGLARNISTRYVSTPGKITTQRVHYVAATFL